jgi:hypothetical protein
MAASGFRSSGHLSFIHQFSKKWHRLASTASVKKGGKFQYDISWIYQINIFSKNLNKAEFKKLYDSKVLSRNFPDLRTSATSMTSTASTTSMASMTFIASFHQKKLLIVMVGSSLAPKWPIQVPFWGIDHQKSNFLLILALFLSEAVEASRYHFFENWWMKLKCPPLLKPLPTIFQENFQSFYPSEPFRIYHFTMRHPVAVVLSYPLIGCWLESVQDFLIKLGIKPLMHLLEISTFSINNVIVRFTKIMNRADKNWAHF